MSVYKNDNPIFLKKSLESIYDNQTVKPDEIIVVFDGPLTKEQLEILQDFKEGKEKIVHYYPQKQNRGLGAALQVGLKKCRNEFIARMDSDDISSSTRFEKQLNFINEHPDIDIFSGNIQEFSGTIENKKGIRKVPTHERD
ncbi:glycosyltransferase, partial [Candidatus Saccharibacteria bacterium]|nr:glycosyltransferase [Candidatus Saccharibacteria bacterium]